MDDCVIKFYDRFSPFLSEHEGRLRLIEINHLKEKCFEIYDARGSSMGISIYILFKGFQTIDYSFLNIKSITYETIQIVIQTSV